MAQKQTVAVVAVAVTAIILIAGYGLLPATQMAQSDFETTLGQTEGTQQTIHGPLLTTLDATNAGENATLTLTNDDTGETTTATINETATETVVVGGVAVDVTVASVGDGEATVTYELSRDAFLSDEAQALVGPILTFVTLVALLVSLAWVSDIL